MFTVITSQIKSAPKTISKDEAIHLIRTMDPIVAGDYHLLKETNKLHSQATYDTYRKQTLDTIEMHNSHVSKDDLVVFVGDISEMELSDPKHIAELYRMIHSLNGRKILIVGNNDNFDDAFYHKCGFEYVERKYIAYDNLIFSHIPLNLEDMKCNSDVVNIHGHIHGSKAYRNMNWKNHIDVYHKVHDNKPLRVSEYLKNFKDGKYNDYFTTHATFATDDNQV